MTNKFTNDTIAEMKVKYPEDTTLHEMLDSLIARKPFVARRQRKDSGSSNSNEASEVRKVTLLLGINTKLISEGNIVSDRVGRSITECTLSANEKIDTTLIRHIEEQIENDLNKELQDNGRDGNYSVGIFSLYLLED